MSGTAVAVVVILALVVVAALVWWSSGRAKGRLRQINPDNDPGVSAAKAETQRNQIRGTFGPFS